MKFLLLGWALALFVSQATAIDQVLVIQNLKTEDGKNYQLVQSLDGNGLVYIDEKGKAVQPIMMKMDNKIQRAFDQAQEEKNLRKQEQSSSTQNQQSQLSKNQLQQSSNMNDSSSQMP